MITKEPNLNYLEKDWLEDMPALQALKNLDQWKAKTVARVLRHHDETEDEETEDGISDWETHRRDEFDYLLGFYSIVEIAMMIGFVKTVPATFRNKHLPVLTNEAVRRYYEYNYPIDLPRRFRERLQTGQGYQVPASAEMNTLFYEFLELTRLIERDKDLESFLWTLDGGWRDGCNFQHVKEALLESSPLLDAVQKAEEEKTELQHALAGFCKFIQFCEGLASLLSRMEDMPVVAEAMWLAHAYWFRQLDYYIGDNLKLAFKSVARWQVGKQNKKALKRRLGEMTALMRNISVPPMTKWKTGLKEKSTKTLQGDKILVEVARVEKDSLNFIFEDEDPGITAKYLVEGFQPTEEEIQQVYSHYGLLVAGMKIEEIKQQTGMSNIKILAIIKTLRNRGLIKYTPQKEKLKIVEESEPEGEPGAA